MAEDGADVVVAHLSVTPLRVHRDDRRNDPERSSGLGDAAKKCQFRCGHVLPSRPHPHARRCPAHQRILRGLQHWATAHRNLPL